MPNWCENRWTLSGSPDTLAAAMDDLTDVADGHRYVLFSKLRPCPDFLRRTRSPSRAAIVGAGTPCPTCAARGRIPAPGQRPPTSRCPNCRGRGYRGVATLHWVEERLGPWGIAVARPMSDAERAVCRDARAWNLEEWTDANWGVNWEPVPEHCDVGYEPGSETAYARFDTPWGPPQPFHAAFVEAHPEVGLSAFFDEPGMQLAGYL